jgi:type II secretory pathway component PulC
VLVLVGACVALVAIVGIVFMVSRTASTARKPEPSVSLDPAPTVSPPATAGQASVQPEAGNSGSPTETQPAATPSPADASRYKITGIMKDPQGNYCAVINGRVLYVEQYIDGAVVKKIERDRVTLDENGREAVVRLF